MSQTIWKFPLSHLGAATIMPQFAEILDVQMQDDILTIWALVDPDQPKVSRKFKIFGTGHHVADGYSFQNYVGTVQDGPLVWHVFEVTA